MTTTTAPDVSQESLRLRKGGVRRLIAGYIGWLTVVPCTWVLLFMALGSHVAINQGHRLDEDDTALVLVMASVIAAVIGLFFLPLVWTGTSMIARSKWRSNKWGATSLVFLAPLIVLLLPNKAGSTQPPGTRGWAALSWGLGMLATAGVIALGFPAIKEKNEFDKHDAEWKQAQVPQKGEEDKPPATGNDPDQVQRDSDTPKLSTLGATVLPNTKDDEVKLRKIDEEEQQTYAKIEKRYRELPDKAKQRIAELKSPPAKIIIEMFRTEVSRESELKPGDPRTNGSMLKPGDPHFNDLLNLPDDAFTPYLTDDTDRKQRRAIRDAKMAGIGPFEWDNVERRFTSIIAKYNSNRSVILAMDDEQLEAYRKLNMSDEQIIRLRSVTPNKIASLRGLGWSWDDIEKFNHIDPQKMQGYRDLKLTDKEILKASPPGSTGAAPYDWTTPSWPENWSSVDDVLKMLNSAEQRKKAQIDECWLEAERLRKPIRDKQMLAAAEERKKEEIRQSKAKDKAARQRELIREQQGEKQSSTPSPYQDGYDLGKQVSVPYVNMYERAIQDNSFVLNARKEAYKRLYQFDIYYEKQKSQYENMIGNGVKPDNLKDMQLEVVRAKGCYDGFKDALDKAGIRE